MTENRVYSRYPNEVPPISIYNMGAWRDIVPLKSRENDVLDILGEPFDSFYEDVYDDVEVEGSRLCALENAPVQFNYYSDDPILGIWRLSVYFGACSYLEKWALPISMSRSAYWLDFTPTEGVSIKKSVFTKSGVFQMGDEEFSHYYIDEMGLSYAFFDSSENEDQVLVVGVRFGPPESRLRATGPREHRYR